jgi:hypothetical protein
MFGAAFTFRGVLSGLEVMSTVSEPDFEVKWYMLAVLIAAGTASLVSGSRRLRLLFGFCCAVNRSLIVEAFRFRSEDIGGVEGVVVEVDVEGAVVELTDDAR